VDLKNEGGKSGIARRNGERNEEREGAKGRKGKEGFGIVYVKNEEPNVFDSV
jgi:hypothetical protein